MYIMKLVQKYSIVNFGQNIGKIFFINKVPTLENYLANWCTSKSNVNFGKLFSLESKWWPFRPWPKTASVLLRQSTFKPGTPYLMLVEVSTV